MSLLKIAVAGVLALPGLLVLVVSAPVVALLSIPSLALLCFRSSDAAMLDASSSKDNTNNDDSTAHAIISGGSSGIGLAIAHDCVRRGMAKVTILARNKNKLETAVKELEKTATKNNSSTKTAISFRSVDVSDAANLKKTAQDILGNNDNKNSGKVYLFCCAGTAHPSYFEDIPSTTFAQLVATNQLGTIYMVQAFLPYMSRGIVQLCSSAAGQVGKFKFLVIF
jgi:NAD(P)-dependent dehydrogenase (short-subunit alcohol dehydrogenase family)